MVNLNAVLFACLLMVTFPTQAQIITVDFSGSVTDLGVLLEGDGVVLGSNVSGK